MGLFDKLDKKTSEGKSGYNPINEQDAWIAILIAAAYADGNMNEMEQEALIKPIVFKTFFTGHDHSHSMKKAIQYQNLYGSRPMLSDCAEVISEEAKLTVFCTIVETLLSDGDVSTSDQSFIEFSKEKLAISDEDAVKIIDVYLIRNKWNKVILD